jgi:Nucleotidyltransferase of unknown function (DUF6036)
VSVDSAVLAVLAAAAPVLRHHGNRWYVFGAQAVTLWGRPRLSADLDITAAIAGPHDEFVAAMQRAGFDVRVADWRDFLDRTRVLPLLHRATEMLLDIVVAGPGLEEEFLDRAVAMDLAGMTVPVISPEDLVVTKLLAGRPKDVEDARTILDERHGQLDLARVKSLLGLLEQALSRSDLIPEFERLSAIASSDRASARPKVSGERP